MQNEESRFFVGSQRNLRISWAITVDRNAQAERAWTILLLIHG
jgi:hypothetical protein